MPPRRCCCVTGCPITSDDFNRADSTTIGAQWTEHVGDWFIVSNKLTISEVGLIRNHALSPYPGNNQVVSAKLYNMGTGTKHRIIVQCDISGTDYYYAEWEYVDASTMNFTLGSSSGGVLKTLVGTPIIEGTIATASMTDGGILCMSDISSRITVCTETKLGEYTGLAAGSSPGATFDDYAFTAHYADNSNCPSCDCGCDGYCLEDNLLATFEELNECPNLDGLEIELTNTGPIKFGSDWYQGLVELCPGGVGGSELIELHLACTGTNSGMNDLKLIVEQGSFITTPGGLNFAFPDPSVSTCNPLALRYGPFSYGNVSGCYNTTCCNGNPCAPAVSTFYIWVTQAPSAPASLFFLPPDDGGSGIESLLSESGI